jgi:hypothetical protein
MDSFLQKYDSNDFDELNDLESENALSTNPTLNPISFAMPPISTVSGSF